jgi:methionyl-tRNA formyltransferase
MGTAAGPSTVGAAEGSGAVRALFFGSGSFAVPILDSLVGLSGIRTLAVVSTPDRPVGRKAVVTPTPVTERARELGLPVLQPVRVRRPEAVEEIAGLVPDVIVLADYGQLIPRPLLDLPPRGFLNLHPSALPRWRGAAPIPATILAGDGESAVTLMVVTEEMDAGPIVATAPLAVRPDDTSVTLEERAATVAAGLLARALPEWLAGRIAARPQPPAGITVTRPLRRDDGLLDPALPAARLERQIRAYQPWPGSYIETPAGRLIVCSAEVVERVPEGAATGTLIREGRTLCLTTSSGGLRLGEVQLAGKKRMSAVELLRGYPALGRSAAVEAPGQGVR